MVRKLGQLTHTFTKISYNDPDSSRSALTCTSLMTSREWRLLCNLGADIELLANCGVLSSRGYRLGPNLGPMSV